MKRSEVERFEDQHGWFNGGPSSGPDTDGQMESRRGGSGVLPRYGWDGFYGAIAGRIHEQGIPAIQAELIREMLDWFENQEVEDLPDESTIRQKTTAFWCELRHA